MIGHSRLTGTLLLASGLLVLGSTIEGLAAPVPARPGKQIKREPQRVSNAQLHEALHVLQATKRTLEAADHDYGGHRVEALKAIGAAERQLRLALQSQHKHARPGAGAGAPPRRTGARKEPEPQAVSNVQLAESIRVLEQTRTFLQRADHDYGGHRAAAVHDIGVAIQQLKTALRFEKKK